MLQQTQVNTVIPYYLGWMKIFPTLTKLARAPLSRVLKSWAGLGYYSRARNLHRTAKIVLKQWRGKFPTSREDLQKLPGIGRYTAAAIASIAFGKPEPVLDGNVKRVLARVFALRDPIDQTRGQKKLWEIAKELVGSTDPGNFNQALMELGALICSPDHPQCFRCPLKLICKAHQLKKENRFPVKARRERIERLDTLAAVIWNRGRVLLEKQPLDSRWGGLWLFPQWVSKNGQNEKKFLGAKIHEELGIRMENLEPRLEIKHGFTKYRVRLRVYEGSPPHLFPLPPWGERKKVRGGMRKWVTPKALSRLPFPRPHQKIAELVQSHA